MVSSSFAAKHTNGSRPRRQTRGMARRQAVRRTRNSASAGTEKLVNNNYAKRLY